MAKTTTARKKTVRKKKAPAKSDQPESATVAIESLTEQQVIRRTVECTGITPIMFGRYPGDNDTKLEWWQKVYLPTKSNVLCLPTENVVSALSSHNTNSFPKRLRDPRKFKKICNACLSFVMISSPWDEHQDMIPFMRDGKKIRMGAVNSSMTVDEKSGLKHHFAVARLEKGIPNPVHRPVLPLPWSLTFQMSIIPNREIKEQEIKNLMEEGGLAVGFGTYRGVYGKFVITRWE